MPSRSPRPPYPPLSSPRIFRILPTASKDFFRKKIIRQQIVKFSLFFLQNPCPQPLIFALNLAYTDNWTHAQRNAGKVTIYAHLVLTFFLDHHILCLQLLVKIYPLSSFNYFSQTLTNHYNCVSYYYFRENKSIVRSLSLPLRLGFPTLCFPDLLS